MAQLGMDIDQATTAINTFTTEAGNLETSIARVDQAFHNTWWMGGDHDRFASEWEGYKNQLRQAKQLLDDCARQLSSQRDQQVSTSS